MPRTRKRAVRSSTKNKGEVEPSATAGGRSKQNEKGSSQSQVRGVQDLLCNVESNFTLKFVSFLVH